MLNLSDKELDRLSREAAEKYEVGDDPAGWPKLEQLLDKELGRPSPVPKTFRPGMPFIYAPVLIVLIGATYFLLNPSKHTSNSTQKSSSSVSVSKTAGNNNAKQEEQLPGKDTAKNQPASSPNKDEETSNNKAAISTNASTNEENNLAGKKEKNISDKKTPAENSIKKSADALPLDNKKAVNNSSVKNNTKDNPGNLFAEKSMAGNDAIINREKFSTTTFSKNYSNKNYWNKRGTRGKNNQQQKNKTDKGQAAIENNEANFNTENNNGQKLTDKATTVILPAITDLKPVATSGLEQLNSNKYYTVNDSILKDRKIQETGLINLDKKNHRKGLYTNRSLQLGIQLSPDFSQVKYDYNNKVGRNIGITVSYQLSGKLSVNSGFIFTTKYYGAAGYDFHLPQGCGIDQDDLDFVISNTHLYEVPLNLRYDVNKTGNTSFFISTGLSSYIMGKESFKFFLHGNNPPIGLSRWQANSYKTNHSYWFSVLNLSAGFETKISNSFSFQFEPYIKLPLTGIGFGKVDLSSYGMNVSVKFSPLLKRSRR